MFNYEVTFLILIVGISAVLAILIGAAVFYTIKENARKRFVTDAAIRKIEESEAALIDEHVVGFDFASGADMTATGPLIALASSGIPLDREIHPAELDEMEAGRDPFMVDSYINRTIVLDLALKMDRATAEERPWLRYRTASGAFVKKELALRLASFTAPTFVALYDKIDADPSDKYFPSFKVTVYQIIARLW